MYDIANGVWYEQPTYGDPPGQLAQGCTVVASAQDGSSHNIYWYGGFNGLDLEGDFSDDVWILSVPSFMWMKLYSGNPSHARAGHRCTKPYPDQMFVVGGYASAPPSTEYLSCLEGGIIQIFNLSSGLWIDSYNPNIWSNYTVPEMIVNMIGGSSTGSATQSAPSPSGFANSTLSSIFNEPYNTAKITTWYPYPANTTLPSSRTTLLPVVTARTPKYLAPVLGVVLGLFFITILILTFLLYRRRNFLKFNSTNHPRETGTEDNRFWVSNWLRATPPADAKSPTVTSDETPMNPYEDEGPGMQEVGGEQVHEMMGARTPFHKAIQANSIRYLPACRASRHRIRPPGRLERSFKQERPGFFSLRNLAHLTSKQSFRRFPQLLS